MTSIDTVYEYAGLRLAETLRAMLSGVGLPLLLGLGGTAWLVHQLASEKASVRELGVHLFSLIVAWWLLSPTESGGMRAPRFLVWLGEGTDTLQKKAVRGVNARFLESPFEWERLAAMASLARVLDPALRRGTDEFLEACAKPALARAEPRARNLFQPGALPYAPPCEERREELRVRIVEHVNRHPAHRAAIEAARRHDPKTADAYRERYLEAVCLRAIDDPGAPTGERALVLASLGGYSYLDPAQSTGEFPWWVKPPWAWTRLGSSLWEGGANAALTGVAELHQAWENRFTSKQQYYLVTTYGPHVYGLSLLFVLGFFPVAGLWALLPGRWTALVNYGKVLASIKLWPVMWAALTQFNQKRSAIAAFDPAERGSGDVFMAVAAMYLLTPGLAFLMVHLAAKAAALPFQQAVPGAAGPGLGPVGPALRVAAVAAKAA
jgi:hypothetical protein